MSQYALFLYDDPTTWEKLNPQQLQEAFGKYMAWGANASEAGHLVAGQKLTINPGKVIRGAKQVVTDGPYSETKEVLGGYYIIQAKDFDEALQRTLNHPHLSYGGTIELREIEVIGG